MDGSYLLPRRIEGAADPRPRRGLEHISKPARRVFCDILQKELEKDSPAPRAVLLFWVYFLY